MASGNVSDLKIWDDGNGPALYAIGSFSQASGEAGTSQVARWDGKLQTWKPLDTGLSGGFSNALEVHGGNLYAAGYFDSASGVAGTAKLAKWDGSSWTSLGAQLSDFDDAVWSLKSHDDGSGPALYVGGNYLGIAGTGINHLARFDGTNYTAVGGGTIGGPVPPLVAEIETWNGDLYIGGRFTEVAGVPASRIAKWNGTSWSALGTGLTGPGVGTAAYAMQIWDDGTGESLFVGGQAITNAGGVATTGVARWDGTQWHAVGGGISPGVVWDLEVFDEGSGAGEALYAVGTFTAAGGNAMNRIARWNGSAWSPVGTGTGAEATVLCAKSFDDGTGPALYIGGSFTTVETIAASRVARYEGCDIEPCGPVDVDCNGVVNIDDLLIVINSWGQTGPPGTIPADVNDDGVVNIDDLLLVINNWG
jgi:hypothetical protein